MDLDDDDNDYEFQLPENNVLKKEIKFIDTLIGIIILIIVSLVAAKLW